MLVLGIETTCDETGCAVVRNGREILSNAITTQIDLHKEFGGVVPELACRRHVDVFIPVLEQALLQAGTQLTAVDLIAVARGPGLVGALLIGLNAAKALAVALDKPFVGINHVEAHLYAALMSHQTPVAFPCLGVVASGSHTAIVLIRALGDYLMIGQTVDDAVGEAFDKVARILGLPYPGGPEIERLALSGDPKRYSFKAGQVKGKPLDFSYSGLKTAVLYATKDQQIVPADVAAAFQEAALIDIVTKSLKAAKQYECQSIVFGGGVTASKRLRQLFAENAPKLSLIWPTFDLTMDNAAMVAGLGYHVLQRSGPSPLSLDVLTHMPLGGGEGRQ